MRKNLSWSSASHWPGQVLTYFYKQTNKQTLNKHVAVMGDTTSRVVFLVQGSIWKFKLMLLSCLLSPSSSFCPPWLQFHSSPTDIATHCLYLVQQWLQFKSSLVFDAAWAERPSSNSIIPQAFNWSCASLIQWHTWPQFIQQPAIHPSMQHFCSSLCDPLVVFDTSIFMPSNRWLYLIHWQ